MSCVAGEPDGTWHVDPPAAEVPPELPEPVLGINFAREGMNRQDWLALCAVHSDAWLMAVLFFYAARFDENGRAELFNLANQHPTVYEVVTGRASKVKNSSKKRNVSGYNAASVKSDLLGVAASIIPQNEPYVPNDAPTAGGHVLRMEDVSETLVGKQAELLWPDDGKWYLIVILDVDLQRRVAKVRYATGEEEELELDEVIEKEEMSLLP
jgi:hypothetical protein